MRVVFIAALLLVAIFITVVSVAKGRRVTTYTLPIILTIMMFLTGAEAVEQYNNKQMSQVVKAVSGNSQGYGECQRFTETVFDSEPSVRGKVMWAQPDKAILKYQECRDAISWIKQKDKDTATFEQTKGMGILIHESYHVAGERDERITECLTATNMYYIFQNLGASEQSARAMQTEYVTYIYSRMKESYYDPTCNPIQNSPKG